MPIAAPICVDDAPITGAITATAELPHIELPTPTNVDNFLSSFNNLYPTK